MKKLLGIVVLGLLLSGNAYAGVNEPGFTSIAGCDRDLKYQHKKLIKKYLKELIKKNETGVLYASCDYDKYSWAADKGKNLKKLHKKVYKECMEYSKKHTGKECYLYAVNDEIVWKFDKVLDDLRIKKNIAEGKVELAEAKAFKCYNSVATPLILESDKKPGRFFEDQPDVNDDYQIHIVYSLLKDSKDKEGDINGAIEKWIQASDKYILKTTKKANKKSNFKDGVAQNIKWDRRKDGKLDISFIRINKTKKELKKSKSGSCGNVFGRTIINAGFNNPKKIYFNFGDYSFKEWPYSGGFPIFNIFAKHQNSNTLKKNEFGYFVLHEALHAMGGIFTCSPKHFEGHNTKKTSDLMSRQGDGRNNTLDPKNDDYWGHENKNCPDMQDSVYFTPTSDTPYDPFEVTCLPKEKWKLTKHDYKNIKDRRGEGEMCFYARSDVLAQWKKELGIFQR